MKIKTALRSKGFTLIELLVVIGILAILLTIVLVAVNPARQFAQANNTKRRSDITQILNAIGQYSADNKGVLPSAISTSTLNIGSAGTDANICKDIVTEYISALPADPQETLPGDLTGCGTSTSTTYDTNYQVYKDADNRVTVSAPGAEKVGDTTPVISITR